MNRALNLIEVSTTVDNQEDAKKIARLLNEKKLVACTQIIGPITSVFNWEGGIQESQEWSCVAKTTVDRFQEIEKAIKGIHPYKLPEIIVTPIIGGSEEYIEWMENETRNLV